MIIYIVAIGFMVIIAVFIYMVSVLLGHQSCNKCGWRGQENECVKEPVTDVFGVTAIIKCPICGNILDICVGFEL